MALGRRLSAPAARLGTRLKRVSTTEYCGPCPKCGGRDRFSVNAKRGVFNCRGCNIGVLLDMVFTTARYHANPLVSPGPGAGAEVTAAGVLNDILRLAGA